MSQKKQLLHELLQEEQEPFHLKDYIQDRSCRPIKKSQEPNPNPYPIQLKKRNPISSSSSPSLSSFSCKNACFFALTSSPADPRRSPAAFIDLHSPKKSPCRASTPGNGAVFLHVPAKTASLLLEAALRIQKQSATASRPRPGSSARFGLFGSLLKRLTLKNSNNKKVKGVNTATSSPPLTSTSPPPPGLSSFPRTGRRSSTVWSGSSEEKDLDCFTSSSGSDSDDREEEEEEIIREVIENSYSLERENDGQFCESPFRFALSTSPTLPGSRTPVFLSPATSPSRRNIEDQEHNNVGGSLKFQVQKEKYEEEKDVEEEKEQSSPVSVLDPPFEDDDEDGGACDGDQTDEDDGFHLECSYAFVQRAKKQLLRKLRKFEKLAGLDPVELEKRMMDQDDIHRDDCDVSGSEEEAECREEGIVSPDAEKNIDMFIMEEFQVRKIPRDMKRLVSDVIDEEERDEPFYANGELMTKRVCKRFESWKDVECNTIDMMVEMDFKGDQDQWKRCREHVEGVVLQIELGIFGSLMEELTAELVVLTEIQ